MYNLWYENIHYKYLKTNIYIVRSERVASTAHARYDEREYACVYILHDIFSISECRCSWKSKERKKYPFRFEHFSFINIFGFNMLFFLVFETCRMLRGRSLCNHLFSAQSWSIKMGTKKKNYTNKIYASPGGKERGKFLTIYSFHVTCASLRCFLSFFSLVVTMFSNSHADNAVRTLHEKNEDENIHRETL